MRTGGYSRWSSFPWRSCRRPRRSPPAQIGKCIDLSGKSAFNARKVADNLGVDADTERAIRARLASYDSVRGFEGLDGLGLAPELIAEITRRIKIEDAARTWGIGAPCPPFKNRAKVIARVKALLITTGSVPR